MAAELLLKTVFREYVKKINNILYNNRNISAATYEKLSISIDSLKMLMIYLDWHKEKHIKNSINDFREETNKSILQIIEQLKKMINDFDGNMVDEDKIEELNKYLEHASRRIERMNKEYIREMIKSINMGK